MICKGTLKNLYASNIEVTDKGIKVVLESTVIEKDSLFYHNFVGRLVNFKYNTHLPSYSEAEAYVKDSCERHPEIGGSTCLYADYGSIEPALDEKRSVKQLKKEFKAQRKRGTTEK